MNAETYITTGEAARLLKISRSTVSRQYDVGVLRGKQNPITGERMISRESVVAVLEKHGLPTDRAALRGVVACLHDPQLRTMVNDLVSRDRRLDLRMVETGADALMACSSERPNLLIVDDGIADISWGHVVDSLKKGSAPKPLNVIGFTRAGHSESDGMPSLDVCLSADSYREENLAGPLYRLLGLSRNLPEDGAKRADRRWPRRETHVPVRIGIYRLKAPRKHSWGKAIIRNISKGGAFLEDIQMESGSIPAEAFRMLLEIDVAPLKDWRAHAQVIRLDASRALSMAVKFVRISETDRQKIDLLQNSVS